MKFPLKTLKYLYIEDNLPQYLQKQFNISEQNIQYHPLTSSLIYDTLNPINSQYLFFLPYGVISSSNMSTGLTINPILRNINQIIPSSNYIEYSVLFKKLYVINIPDFSSSYFDFTSNVINFNNNTDILVFSFLCYISEDSNIDSIEQLIVDNSNNILSNNYISKKMLSNEFGTYSLVGITINPNGKSNGKLKIRINKKPNTGNKIFGTVIISEPVLFQYQTTNNTLIPPFFNNLYPYSIPMFNLSESLQQYNNNGNYTIMFVFTPYGSQVPSNSDNDYLNYYLFSFGQNNPQNNIEYDEVYTQRQFINQMLNINTPVSSTGYYNNINESKTITLKIQTKRYDSSLNEYQQSTNINIKDFLYVPHLQIIVIKNNHTLMDVYIYFNFNSNNILSIINIPIQSLSEYQQKFILNNNIDFVLGGLLNNKVNPRDYFTNISNQSNILFRDLIFINNYQFNNINISFDKISLDNVIKPIFYKVIND